VLAKAIANTLLVLLTTASASGQQPSPQPTNLVLEIHYFQNEPPIYLVVPPKGSAPNGVWSVRFPRVQNWQSPTGTLPVRAVNVQTVLAGELVRVLVSVMVGAKTIEQEDSVGVYTLREGEKVRIEEVAQRGVEPFDVALVRVTPSVADLPQVISKANSIGPVNVQAAVGTLPSYRVTVRNLSDKNVSALFIKVGRNFQEPLTSMPQGEDGAPLILAGGVCDLIEPAIIKASPILGGHLPVPLMGQTIEILTAVFEDGSFEGDLGPARTFRGFVKGRKIQLPRLVALFQSALQNQSVAPEHGLELLRKNVAALGIEADSNATHEVLSEFPNLPKGSEVFANNYAEGPIVIAMTGLRRDALSAIDAFRAANPNLDSPTWRNWLIETKQRYETWLSRLQNPH